MEKITHNCTSCGGTGKQTLERESEAELKSLAREKIADLWEYWAVVMKEIEKTDQLFDILNHEMKEMNDVDAEFLEVFADKVRSAAENVENRLAEVSEFLWDMDNDIVRPLSDLEMEADGS